MNLIVTSRFFILRLDGGSHFSTDLVILAIFRQFGDDFTSVVMLFLPGRKDARDGVEFLPMFDWWGVVVGGEG